MPVSVEMMVGLKHLQGLVRRRRIVRLILCIYTHDINLIDKTKKNVTFIIVIYRILYL